MSWSPPAPGTSEVDLVAQIKELQRSDPHAKEQWVSYCDLGGQGVKDPAKHSADFLGAFLAQLHSGIPVPRATVEDNNGCLGDAIKLMQKKSPAFKDIWGQFCQIFGAGRMDPARHDSAYHMQFLDHLAQQASGGVAAPMLPMLPGAEGPPQKRLRDATGVGLGMAVGGGGAKEQLVAQVKAFQRMGTEQKEFWSCYADTYLQGVKDPSRHDAAVLEEFCTNHNVPAASGTPIANIAGPAAWMGVQTGGGGGEKEQLANQVKAFQRMGMDQKELWSTYADTYLGGVKDPSRHDAATLKEFCDNHGVPAAAAGAGAPKVGMMGGMGGGLVVPMDPDKEALVQRVKIYQKAAKENAEAWLSFCGTTKDPARHDAAKLREFCDTYIMV